MPKSRTDAKFLLIQARSDQFIKTHELACFRSAGGLRDDQLVSHDLLEGPLPDDPTAGFDGILLGGVSDHLAADLFPNRLGLVELVRRCRERRFPLLAVCWGAQFLTLQTGGTVENNTKCQDEVAAQVFLSEAGSSDAAFSGLSKEFYVNIGHNEHIARLPEGGQLLAYSGCCPVQAFRIAGTPIYGLQFHPEMDKADELVRLNHLYEGKEDAVQKMKEAAVRLQETPEARRIISSWMDLAISVG